MVSRYDTCYLLNSRLAGAQLVLWVTCAQYLWKHYKDGSGTGIMLCYITLLIIVETIFCISQARTIELMYIDNRYYPGGPWQYFLDTQHLPIDILFCASLFLVTFLCDIMVVSSAKLPILLDLNPGIQLWRCWVIWMSSGPIRACVATFIPFIMLVASIRASFRADAPCFHADKRYSHGHTLGLRLQSPRAFTLQQATSRVRHSVLRHLIRGERLPDRAHHCAAPPLPPFARRIHPQRARKPVPVHRGALCRVGRAILGLCDRLLAHVRVRCADQSGLARIRAGCAGVSLALRAR